MAAARFHDRFRPTASAEVVNLLSDEEDEEQRPEPRDIDTASASNRAPPEPRRVHLRPAAFAALLPALGEEPPEHDLDRGFVFFENQKLFCEFMEYCGTLTEENPEVMSFLQKKYDKAFPDYLASTEFRNILGRCLTRVQGKKSKVFVYINELCTALKANSQKNKLALVGRENSKLEVEGGPSVTDGKERGACPERTSVPTEGAPSTSVPTLADRKRSGSRRQIRYLENLLKVYADEIRRLQEREMNLEELEDEDSSYIQEHRLKKKMMKIFEKLCELKNCLNLTGRVIEQRIPFTGTRYPEINRKVERFINKPDHFPDYLDIRNIMQKVSTRHSLGLSHRQIHSMAQDVFREVGNRLQERRHLDLVYNFGSHLTDDYKPAKDPASMDNTLEKRLRQNRSVALGRLDEVVKKFAEIQDVGEMEEEEKRKKKLQQQQATALSASEAGSKGVTEQTEAQTEAQTEEEEEVVKEEEVEDAASDEEEEEEEDLSSETDIEEELSKIEMAADPEEEPQEDETGEGSDVDEVDVLPEDSLQSSDEESEGPEEADAEAGEEGRVVPSGERPEQAGAEDSPTCTRDGGELEQHDVVDGHSAHSVGNSPAGTDRELGDRQPVRQTKRSRADSSGQKEEAVTPPSEACEDISSDEQKSVTTLTTRMCDTGTMVCSEAQPLTLKDNANLDKTPVIDKENLLQTDRQVSGLCLTAVNGKEGDSVLDGSPVAKRIKREGAVNQGRNVEEIELMVIEGPDCVPCLPGDKSPLPAVDSTQADSPLVSVVTSSQTSPARHKRVNVATQCDPEEIIILSDSD